MLFAKNTDLVRNGEKKDLHYNVIKIVSLENIIKFFSEIKL